MPLIKAAEIGYYSKQLVVFKQATSIKLYRLRGTSPLGGTASKRPDRHEQHSENIETPPSRSSRREGWTVSSDDDEATDRRHSIPRLLTYPVTSQNKTWLCRRHFTTETTCCFHDRRQCSFDVPPNDVW